MHHYAFNIGDYRKDTGHLSLLEHGVYRMLLDSYYANEGPIEADDAKLMRTHCIRTADEQQAYKNVISDFFFIDGNHYRHTGCDKVLAKIYEKSAKAKESAEKRWASKNKGSKPDKCADYANDMRTHSERNANGMLPITHNPIPITHLKPSAGAEKKFTDADIGLAQDIFTKILQVATKTKPPNFDKWADTIRLMRENDNLTHEEIYRVFCWANQDAFWKTNILSVAKLRDKFAQLSAKEQDHANTSANSQQHRLSKTDAAFAEYLAQSGSSGDCFDAEYAEVHETAEPERSARLPSLGVSAG